MKNDPYSFDCNIEVLEEFDKYCQIFKSSTPALAPLMCSNFTGYRTSPNLSFIPDKFFKVRFAQILKFSFDEWVAFNDFKGTQEDLDLMGAIFNCASTVKKEWITKSGFYLVRDFILGCHFDISGLYRPLVLVLGFGLIESADKLNTNTNKG